ncbi:MAG: hypothetical protein SVN78_06885 [Deferribacterota bacterium]|nr:hypothetical protein [Deferribacterota bacterium]
MIFDVTKLPFFSHIKYLESKKKCKVYFVGGIVRDFLLNRTIKDIDIVVFNISYIEFATGLARLLSKNIIAFKDNIRIVIGEITIDISKPKGSNIYRDLGCRDFTINSLALTTDGKLIGNIEDINKKLIRINYDNTFLDDPLRILRAFRFAAEINFNIDNNTFKKIKELKHLLLDIASERIYNELYKTFTAKYFNLIIDIFIDSEVFISLLKVDNVNKKNINNTEKRLLYNLFKVSDLQYYKKNDKFILIIITLIIPFIYVQNFNINHLKKFIIVKKIYTLIKKTINTFKKLDKNLKKCDLYFIIYNNYSVINYVVTILNVSRETFNGDYNILYKRVRDAIKSIDINRASLINGNDLKLLGIKESKVFGKLLNEVKYKLAFGMIESKKAAIEYIKKRAKNETFTF